MCTRAVRSPRLDMVTLGEVRPITRSEDAPSSIRRIRKEEESLTSRKPPGGAATDKARYAQVSALLRKAIEVGQYQVDDVLPTEAQLGELYSISRFTARQALRILTNEGLIVRRQGSGSRVIASSPPLRYVVVLNDESEVLRYTEETVAVYRRSSRRVTPRTLRSLGVDDPTGEWVSLTGFRKVVADNRRIAVSDAFIRSEYASAFDPDTTSPVVFPRIVSEFGVRINYIDQEISATILTPQVARRLNREPGDPAIKVLRRFVGHDVGLFEASTTIHPADLYTHLTRLIRFYPEDSAPSRD
jgi:GntR family transcriptional regulator